MAQPQPSWLAHPSHPALGFPAGACDAHCHVFGPSARFPYAANAPFVPADAPKEALFALHDMLGITRCVVVQSSCHGYDNAAAADAIAAKGGAYRGVALLPTTASAAELRALDAQGFCGVRFNFMKHLGQGTPIEDVIRFAHQLAEFGWHLQIHFAGSLIGELAPALKRSPVPVVIDHMGRMDASLGVDHPDFRMLLELMRDPRFYVKVSGTERLSRQPAPYADAIAFGRKLVAEFGDRVFWGTDWPHPNIAGDIPDDGVLADLLAQIAPGSAALQALLVDNPRRFYRFPADQVN